MTQKDYALEHIKLELKSHLNLQIIGWNVLQKSNF